MTTQITAAAQVEVGGAIQVEGGLWHEVTLVLSGERDIVVDYMTERGVVSVAGKRITAVMTPAEWAQHKLDRKIGKFEEQERQLELQALDNMKLTLEELKKLGARIDSMVRDIGGALAKKRPADLALAVQLSTAQSALLQTTVYWDRAVEARERRELVEKLKWAVQRADQSALPRFH